MEKKKSHSPLLPLSLPPQSLTPPFSLLYNCIWLHSTNELIQRWLPRQQCDESPTPSCAPIGFRGRSQACESQPHLPVSWAAQPSSANKSCSTDTVSHSVEGRRLRWQPARNTILLLAGFKVESDLTRSLSTGGVDSCFWFRKTRV